MPAFSASHASVTLTQSERVVKVVVMRAHEQLSLLKVGNCACVCVCVCVCTRTCASRDILGLTLWDMHQNVDILKERSELPVEEQLRQGRLQFVGHVQWIDVISRDLVGVTNWQEVVKDRAKW